MGVYAFLIFVVWCAAGPVAVLPFYHPLCSERRCALLLLVGGPLLWCNALVYALKSRTGMRMMRRILRELLRRLRSTEQ